MVSLDLIEVVRVVITNRTWTLLSLKNMRIAVVDINIGTESVIRPRETTAQMSIGYNRFQPIGRKRYMFDNIKYIYTDLDNFAECTSTKHSPTCYLGECTGLLDWFDGRKLTLVVVYDSVAKTINPRTPIETHSPEEADTLIALHVILIIKECTYSKVDVWSPDIDVLILLMDLESRGILGRWQN